MGAAVALTLLFVVVEAVCGWFAHSLALLSDAGHNLADAAALGFSWYALWIASKPSHEDDLRLPPRRHLRGLANAVSLVLIAVFIGWEAIARIREPEVANGPVMIVVAVAAIIVNLVIGLWLHKGSKDDLNIRSAYLHMLGDAVSAFGRGDRRRARRDDARPAGGSRRVLADRRAHSLQQLRGAA